MHSEASKVWSFSPTRLYSDNKKPLFAVTKTVDEHFKYFRIPSQLPKTTVAAINPGLFYFMIMTIVVSENFEIKRVFFFFLLLYEYHGAP